MKTLLLHGFDATEGCFLPLLFPGFHCVLNPKWFGDGFLSRQVLRRADIHAVVVPGNKQQWWLNHFVNSENVPIWRVEDGFVRSIGVKTKGHRPPRPYSLCVDKSGIYYDATKPSDLDNMLLKAQLSQSQQQEARDCMSLLNRYGITKYNEIARSKPQQTYGNKSKPRILVVGQVEGDLSIKYGCKQSMTNNQLVELAARENPEAQIIYKVHPYVVAKRKKKGSNPKKVAHLANIISTHLGIDDSLRGVDRVYTISSLTGFEALIRGIPVTTIGAPFYGGWGLTDTRQSVAHRNKSLNLETLFHVAYLQYPKYFNPITGQDLTLQQLIDEIVSTRDEQLLCA